MAEAKITLTLKPEEYRFLRLHLELALVQAKAQLREETIGGREKDNLRAESIKLHDLLGKI